MYVLTAHDVREIDEYNGTLGQTDAVLMANFAARIADEIESAAVGLTHRRVLVLAGPGNNGGDGIAAARILTRRGFRTALLAPLGVKAGTAAAVYAGLAAADGIPVYADTEFDGYDVIVDALFGIGLDRDVSGACAELIGRANAAQALKIAIDVPSGLDERGVMRGAAFRADITVTACGYKRALLVGQGQNFCGRIAVADIMQLFPRTDYPVYVDGTALPQRERVSHKGSYADVFLICGSTRYAGAGRLALAGVTAALRSGAGLARLVTDGDLREYYADVRDEMLLTLPDETGELDALIPNGAVVAIGSGLGRTERTARFVSYFLTRDVKLLIDADAITTFGDYDGLRAARADVLFTPHVKEFARLVGCSVDDAQHEPERLARDFAAEYGCSVLLKSNFALATDGRRVFYAAEGTPAQAKGGSGDVLLGVTAALAGQFDSLAEAGIRASVLCGHAAREVESERSQHGVLASDVAACLARLECNG